ncbi:MAG: choice-of-anchor B family protein [Flavobacteriaceae bacterium]|nr:choice-of-anchor B family protein [Flavobacteriaceae bacterium]
MPKQLLFILLLVVYYFSIAQTECTGGMAGTYPCNDYDLMSHIDLSTLNASLANDSWGWTDPSDNSEYAIVGLNNGTAFINVTDPLNAVYLGKLPTATSNSTWRDIKVYNNHAYIVSEAGSHGMQVFDLTQLRSVTSPPQTFSATYHFTDFGACHNIALNEDTGYAYAIGCNSFSGGPHFIDLSNPALPVSDGGYSTDGYTHDAQIVTYNGPDLAHVGKEIFLGSNGDEIVIVDVTDKSNPIKLSEISYPQYGYVHQGWLTEDHVYFILGDETDELNTGFNTRTMMFDFTDLDNPVYIDDYEGPTGAIDHNGYIKGNIYYQSSYSRGVAMLDVSDVQNGNLTEVGFFDTYPPNNNTNFSGVWNVYPFFSSNNIVVSDLDGGFFLIRQSGTLSIADNSINGFSLYPNPASSYTTIEMPNSKTISNIKIYDILGQILLDFNPESFASTYQLDVSNYAFGTYILRINNSESKKLIIE